MWPFTMKWNYKELNEIKYKKLQKVENVSELLAQVLANKDIDIETVNSLINEPVEKFIQIQDEYVKPENLILAAETIKLYAENKNAEIWIFADYDTDGLTSGYIMTDFLRKVTNNPVYVYYPEKQEGYGLSMPFCKDLLDHKKACKKDLLVVTVDNGTSCNTEVDFLKNNDIEVIITDHHQPKESLPNCVIYNPQIFKDTDAGKELAGCGVAFKVIHEVERLMGFDDYTVTAHYMPYVAIGTIADMMPMRGENPYFVRMGFNAIAYDQDNEFAPLKVWKDKLGIQGDTFTPKDVSWTIAPRLNSCGRMGDITKGASILFSTDEDTVIDMAIEIDKLDKKRKNYTKKVFEDIKKNDDQFTDRAVCTFDCTGYPAGIAGSVANKMLETYSKPSFVFSLVGDNYVGSARSFESMPLTDLMKKELAEGNILTYGGHKQACGFEFGKDKLTDLVNSLDIAIRNASAVVEGDTEPTIDIDACINLDDVNRVNYEQLANYVFGGEPIFAFKNLKVTEVKYSKNNPSNVCFKIAYRKYGFDIWAWGMADLYKEIGSPKTIDIAGNIDANFMSPGKYTVRVLDFKQSEG